MSVRGFLSGCGAEAEHKSSWGSDASWIINRSFSTPDSDSEEHNSARGGWPPLSGLRSHGNPTRKRRSASSPTSLLSSQKSQKKKHKHLSLLLEEAGLSSSDDSFDQGYWPNLTAPRPSLLSQTACVFVCVSLRQLFSDCSLLRPSLPLLLLASVQSCLFLKTKKEKKKEFTNFYGVFYCLDCKQFSVAFVHWKIVWIVRFFS